MRKREKEQERERDRVKRRGSLESRERDIEKIRVNGCLLDTNIDETFPP